MAPQPARQYPGNQAHLKTLLGWALVVACASLLTRTTLSARLPPARRLGLVQAVPPVAVAALGQALFGHVELNVAGALIIGSVPGTFVGATVSSRAPDAIVRTIIVALLASSGLAKLVTSNAGLAWAIGIVAVVGLALWGTVDGALHLSEDWQSAGHDRTTWVALMGVGAPVGVGPVASAVHAFRIRPSVVADATANSPDDP
jgi:hypothetical protein